MAKDMEEAGSNGFSRIIPYILIGLVLFTIAVRYAEPIRDGDLWWQMAYGKYLVENKTLVPDHTVFSWTPADVKEDYCAWISEIFLYLTYSAFGLPFMFVFRYLCLLTFLFLFYLHARRLKMEKHPFTWLIAIIGVFMSMTAAFIKPEIFSYVFICTAVFIWWRIKEAGDSQWRICYAYPVLFLVWVNTHGAFVFGATFLAVLFFGEMLNQLMNSDHRLKGTIRKHFFIAVFVSAAACFITPYTWHYIWQLINKIILPGLATGKEGKGIASVLAYRSIFTPGLKLFHYHEFFFSNIIFLLLMSFYPFRFNRIDWTLVVSNVVFAWLYCIFLRTTYFWAPVFSFSAVWLLSEKPPFLWPEKRKFKRALEIVILTAVVFLSARACFEAVCSPFDKRWFGFGNGYQNPVYETAFIKDHFEGMNIGNDYGIGGYLMWELWPKFKIMMDPRQFPYMDWYPEYRSFISGNNINGFMEKYPADLWILRYRYPNTVRFFLRSPEWRLAYYGPICAVFVRNGSPADNMINNNIPMASEGIKEVRNINILTLLYNFAFSIKDYAGMKTISYENEKYYLCPGNKNIIHAYQELTDGVIAYRDKDYEKAAAYLMGAFQKGIYYSRDYLTNAYLNIAAEKISKEGDGADVYEALNSALAIDPNNLTALFNLAMVKYSNALKGNPNVNSGVNFADAKSAAAHFLKVYSDMPKEKRNRNITEVMEKMAEGKYQGKIMILKP